MRCKNCGKEIDKLKGKWFHIEGGLFTTDGCPMYAEPKLKKSKKEVGT
jgi:hypothetical protein